MLESPDTNEPSPKPRIKRSRVRSSPSTKHDKPPSKRKKRKSRSRKKLTEKVAQIIVEDSPIIMDGILHEEVDTLVVTPVVEEECKAEPSEELWEDAEPQTIEIRDAKYDIFRRFLEYIYSGYFDMAQPYAFELLPLASKYKLDHLKTMCGVKIQLSIDTANVLVALSLADRCKADELKSFCLSFIAENREAVTPALRKGELHPDLLKEVKKWLTVQSLGEKLQSNTTPIYQSILT